MSDEISVDRLQREIELEREQLVRSISAMREELERMKRAPLSIGAPVIAGIAMLGFVAAGGIPATIRLLGVRSRRRRQHAERAPLSWLLGRF
jgi:hypothetical protein